MNHKIDVVLFEREPGCWVGQCLQYDIGAQANSLPDLVYELQRSLAGHVCIEESMGKEPFRNLPSAPQEYWDRWTGARIDIVTEQPNFRIPSVAHVPTARMRVAA